ncbi:MAG: GIY-YIG nuclease family protein [Candidatus Uhrbacteria bacterium]|nr:GIY-YIG nuclease family protein [Candidatus Uhrbacteria bacterium]
MAWVYILQEIEEGRYYIGSTDNLERRLKQHQTGHTYSTHRLNNPSLVLSQEYESLEEARKIELRLKKLKHRDYIQKMVEEGRIRIKV